MSEQVSRQNPPEVQAFDASDAFVVYAALRTTEAANPALADNEYWQDLCAKAFARFLDVFEVAK